MLGSGPVLIAGAGALGSVVGGLLARAGWPVTLLGRRAHLDVVGSRGLLIEGLFGTHRVTGLSCVVSRVIFGAEVAEPGRARVTVYADPVLIGSPDPFDTRRRDAAVAWAADLTAAGIPAESSETIVAELWAKLLYSAALNPLGALLGLSYGALAADADTRTIMDAVIEEAFAVAWADGVTLRWGAAEDYREEFYRRLVPATAAHRSSMLQDLERGRPTEIEAINGWVAARAAAHGVPAPVNATLTRLLRARARLPATEARWSR